MAVELTCLPGTLPATVEISAGAEVAAGAGQPPLRRRR
jgi:hypothetical protein